MTEGVQCQPVREPQQERGRKRHCAGREGCAGRVVPEDWPADSLLPRAFKTSLAGPEPLAVSSVPSQATALGPQGAFPHLAS